MACVICMEELVEKVSLNVLLNLLLQFAVKAQVTENSNLFVGYNNALEINFSLKLMHA